MGIKCGNAIDHRYVKIGEYFSDHSEVTGYSSQNTTVPKPSTPGEVRFVVIPHESFESLCYIQGGPYAVRPQQAEHYSYAPRVRSKR